MLDKNDQNILLRLARQAIITFFSSKEPTIDKKVIDRLSSKKGIFVTLTKKGKLRGCIGFIKGYYPLYESVIRAARSAAFSDPRFPELKEEEMDEIKIEISVLSIPEEIRYENKEELLEKIEVGRHGLIVQSEDMSGLLLPQVAIEYGWDKKEFLEHTCTKAGLPKDVWKDIHVNMYTFEAQIFNEQ